MPLVKYIIIVRVLFLNSQLDEIQDLQDHQDHLHSLINKMKKHSKSLLVYELQTAVNIIYENEYRQSTVSIIIFKTCKTFFIVK